MAHFFAADAMDTAQRSLLQVQVRVRALNDDLVMIRNMELTRDIKAQSQVLGMKTTPTAGGTQSIV
jgi:hypothetical protein